MSQPADPAPDPADTPGLEPGGAVAPGDTPPGASQDAATGVDRRRLPNQQPATPNRTPMIVTLVVLAIIVVAVVGYGIAQITAYAG